MENRSIVHYKRNTLKYKHKKNSKLKIESKIFATKKCYFCGKKFNEFRIVCDVCGNCQYCGLFAECSNICRLCGNFKPISFKVRKKKKFVI